MTIIYDPEKHFLGKLCKHNHDWENSGLSLRFMAGTKQCVTCSRGQYQTRKEYHKLYNKENADKKREYDRIYRQENADKIREYKQLYSQENPDIILEYHRNYRKENADKFREHQQNYRQENPDRIRKYQQKYFQTPSGKSSRIRNEQKRRAIKNQCHSLPYKPEDILNLFDGECAYCGSKDKLTLDHFIPITKGGSNVQGNLLPACQSCNCSKNSKDVIEWYKKQTFFTQKRWKQILKILGKTESNYDQIPLF